jgi:hypothetical protein
LVETADDLAEIEYLEQTMQGKATPRFSPGGTCGRLAELYFLHPELPGFSEKALIFVRAGLTQVDTASPLYPKLKHFEAMALRLLPEPESGSLGIQGSAAQSDRAAFDSCYASMPKDALVFAQQWGNWAWKRREWAEAAEAYSRAARCVNKLLREHIGGEAARLQILQEVSCVTRGAYALIENNQETDAVLLLERANHFFYSMHDDGRALQLLEATAPDLVKELLSVLKSRLPYEQRFDALGRLVPEEEARIKRKDELVVVVRTHEGFEDFATFPDWQTIQVVARQQPLLYMFSCDYGGKALFLGENREGSLRCVTLALDLSTQVLRETLQPFLRAEFERTGMIEESCTTLTAVLEKLDTVVGASLGMIREQFGLQDRPLIGIPIGLVALAPWHACVPHMTYAYSARSVKRSMQTAVNTLIDHALAVDNPRPLPPTYDPLLLSVAETGLVGEHFTTETLSGTQATTSAIMKALPQARLVHMSCHGTIDKRFGYSSVLLLANRELFTSQHLRELPALQARLVVLSACATGIIALSTEQTLTMPFHFIGAGASGVLATMWHTDETATLLCVQAFYSAWTGATSPAEALQTAQHRLATATTSELRTGLINVPHAEDALRALDAYADDAIPFAHPWYWGAFFIAGM